MPTGKLDEVGEYLCGEVRAGRIDVDDASNRWGRELERAAEVWTPVAYLTALVAWTVSGLFQFMVSLIAFLGTLVVIAVGLKKLRGTT